MSDKINCTGCGKKITLNKWERCQDCRFVMRKCRCGVEYKGGPKTEECSTCLSLRRSKYLKRKDSEWDASWEDL